jgi:hypothetical protein
MSKRRERSGSRGRCGTHNDSARKIASGSVPCAWPPTVPTGQPRCRGGWSDVDLIGAVKAWCANDAVRWIQHHEGAFGAERSAGVLSVDRRTSRQGVERLRGNGMVLAVRSHPAPNTFLASIYDRVHYLDRLLLSG